jgi:hypothetical protein
MDGFIDQGMVVTKEQWAPGHDIIDVFLAVFHKKMRSLSSADEQWGHVDVFAGPDRAIDSPRDNFLGGLEKCL